MRRNEPHPQSSHLRPPPSEALRYFTAHQQPPASPQQRLFAPDEVSARLVKQRHHQQQQDDVPWGNNTNVGSGSSFEPWLHGKQQHKQAQRHDELSVDASASVAALQQQLHDVTKERDELKRVIITLQEYVEELESAAASAADRHSHQATSRSNSCLTNGTTRREEEDGDEAWGGSNAVATTAAYWKRQYDTMRSKNETLSRKLVEVVRHQHAKERQEVLKWKSVSDADMRRVQRAVMSISMAVDTAASTVTTAMASEGPALPETATIAQSVLLSCFETSTKLHALFAQQDLRRTHAVRQQSDIRRRLRHIQQAVSEAARRVFHVVQDAAAAPSSSKQPPSVAAAADKSRDSDFITVNHNHNYAAYNKLPANSATLMPPYSSSSVPMDPSMFEALSESQSPPSSAVRRVLPPQSSSPSPYHDFEPPRDVFDELRQRVKNQMQSRVGSASSAHTEFEVHHLHQPSTAVGRGTGSFPATREHSLHALPSHEPQPPVVLSTATLQQALDTLREVFHDLDRTMRRLSDVPTPPRSSADGYADGSIDDTDNLSDYLEHMQLAMAKQTQASLTQIREMLFAATSHAQEKDSLCMHVDPPAVVQYQRSAPTSTTSASAAIVTQQPPMLTIEEEEDDAVEEGAMPHMFMAKPPGGSTVMAPEASPPSSRTFGDRHTDGRRLPIRRALPAPTATPGRDKEGDDVDAASMPPMSHNSSVISERRRQIVSPVN